MIGLSNGIEVIGPTRIVLDGKREEGINVISHAHRDHLGRVKRAVATRETAVLAGLERYKENLKLDDLEIRLVNAGHILGSSQVEILNGHHIVYTGDIRLRDSILFEAGEILNPEILILESTFGLPTFRFPDYQEVYSQMERWIRTNLEMGRHVILGGYTLGKAQELTKLVTVIGETPIVTRDIWENNKMYEMLGASLGEYVLVGSPEAKEIAKSPSVFIVPMKLAGWKAKTALKLSYGRDSVAGVATGWSVIFSFRSKGVDRAFPLSDHSDFRDLVRYATESGAREVITVHGYANELANYLRKLGINAHPIKKL